MGPDISDYTDLFSVASLMLRLTIPASMVFLTRFRLYLYYVVPVWCVTHQLISIWTEKQFKEAAETCAHSVLPKDYSSSL